MPCGLHMPPLVSHSFLRLSLCPTPCQERQVLKAANMIHTGPCFLWPLRQAWTQSHSTRVPLTPSPKKTSLLALSSENAETRSTWEGEWECLPRGPSYVWSQLTFYTLCVFGPGGLMSSASVARTHAALCYWPRLCGTLEGPHSVPVLGALFLYSILSLHLLLPCSVPD